jgi:phospholipase/carboxylesterase
MHGFGAPGDDLAPLWRVLDVPDARFVFPEALHAIPGYGARAWWMIDMERIERALASGETRDLSRDVPAGLTEARDAVVEMLAEMDRAYPSDRLFIGGFSQGAMLACDVALRTDRALAGLVMMSGTFIAESEWSPLMTKRRGLRAFMSHGQNDRLLPFSQSERLRDAFVTAGIDVAWSPFRGAHEIPGSVLDALGRFLRG